MTGPGSAGLGLRQETGPGPDLVLGQFGSVSVARDRFGDKSGAGAGARAGYSRSYSRSYSSWLPALALTLALALS